MRGGRRDGEAVTQRDRCTGFEPRCLDHPCRAREVGCEARPQRGQRVIGGYAAVVALDAVVHLGEVDPTDDGARREEALDTRQWGSSPSSPGHFLPIGAVPGATLRFVPTQRKRHSITESDAVEDVLRRLEAATGERPDLGELVTIGGNELLRRTEKQQQADDQRRTLRRRLLERTRTGEGIDQDALTAARAHGWVHG